MSAPPRAYGAYLLYEELTFESLFWAALRYQISEQVESLYEREWVPEGEFLCVPLLWALLDVVREEEERLGAAAVAAGALCAEIIESRCKNKLFPLQCRFGYTDSDSSVRGNVYRIV